MSKFNKNKTHCKNGHEFTLENTTFVNNGKHRNCKICKNKSSLASRKKLGRKDSWAKPSKTYEIWTKIKNRCNNQNDSFYYRYGGRGISVCDGWNVFENFIRDMGERPSVMEIDRLIMMVIIARKIVDGLEGFAVEDWKERAKEVMK